MLYAIELFFDPKTEKTIQTFFQKMARVKISSFMLDTETLPHISLLVFRTEDLPAVISSLDEIAQNSEQLALYFPALGTFHNNGVLFLLPTVTTGLQDLHRDLFKKLKSHIKEVPPWYLPGALTYHCTLAVKLSRQKLMKALQLALRTKLPKAFKASKISLVAIHEENMSFRAETLFTLPLRPSRP